MEALEPKEEACEVQAAIEKSCAHHATKEKQAYVSCLTRIQNLDKMSEKDLHFKCSVNGIAVVDFNNKQVPRSELISLLSEKANCTGQYFDYFHAIDHCAAGKLFNKLT